MATQQVGLLTTSVTNSGFLTGLYVVFTPILAVLLYRNMPHPVTWVAALLSLMGIYFLSGGDLGQLVKGDILTIFSAMFWGLQVVLIARFVGESGRPLALSQVQFTITAVLALLAALVIEPIEWGGILEVAPQILYAGIFASGFAFTIQVIGQRYTSATQAAIFLSAEAPFAALFAFIFLDEKISSIGFLGCALILAAMLAVELVPQWQVHSANRVSEH
jgi:drug/metabolite transporter (DMT)-like permease